MTAVDAWLDAAQARADAATPGPWEMQGDSVYTILIPATSTTARRPAQRVAEVWTTDDDTVAIAAARTDLPAAIAALREALRYLDDPDERLMGHSSPAVYVEPLRHAIASALGVSES